MIIVKLTGGLGNQLFQYSLGRYLAIKNNCGLKLDITGFETYKLHNYTLGNFKIIEKFANSAEILLLNNPISRSLSSYFPSQRKMHIKEQSSHFDPNILNAGRNVYLEGYWQSENYFKGIGDTIRKDLTLRDPLGEEAKKIAEQISSHESVSLHIRRGDYAKNERTREVHGLCSPEYYERSISYISRRSVAPRLFIFSDDIEWAKANLNLSGLPATFVSDGNDKIKNFEELYLMSLCKHNILANSTFSWWGAWLNVNKDKIVIAPKKWFNSNKIDAADLIPSSWITIE